MPAERYFSPTPLLVDEIVTLLGEECHHLLRVMRAKEGDTIEVVNGQGILAKATIGEISKKEAQLKVISVEKEPPPSPPLILAQAIPRLNRLDTIIEKGTELGMTHLWLFPGIHSERKELTSSQKERAKKVVVAALKQCGRLYLPEISFMASIGEWEKPNLPVMWGDTSAEAPPLIQCQQDNRGVIFVIGPEKGFDEREEETLRKLGGQGVKLHNNILRTDTAAILAIGLLSHLYPNNLKIYT